jgi:hypothetical protein
VEDESKIKRDKADKILVNVPGNTAISILQEDLIYQTV